MGRDSLGPESFSEAALVRWGELIGSRLEPPLWISLRGPLGAGKSVLARAICRGAGVGGHIPSPSFTLVQCYHSARGFQIHHVDLFRLNPGDPLEPLGWDELVGDEGVVLLEWADRAEGQQPADRWEVAIDYGPSTDLRVVSAGRLGGAGELIPW
ncbi:MAG: tRNA (adenosine(37)-N6)-threonylcarbamoyltransferase complex ATPase subunit type 1 TsaE [Gemmatimonadota bacterium]|nr:MAG: tRNA (adenosine(37)-N6)-threonylcarbamoyltransferase complex ATPase subunit type 1 TsaE [Gemmatimonadota bacterium]